MREGADLIDIQFPLLIDSCVWIDHSNKRIPQLTRILDDSGDMILWHKHIIGEMMVGGYWKSKHRDLLFIMKFAEIKYPTDEYMFAFVKKNALEGTGIGWIDAQLLAACKFYNARLLTRDKRLHKQALRLNLAA